MSLVVFKKFFGQNPVASAANQIYDKDDEAQAGDSYENIRYDCS